MTRLAKKSFFSLVGKKKIKKTCLVLFRTNKIIPSNFRIVSNHSGALERRESLVSEQK